MAKFMEDWSKVVVTLNSELGLTPYESQAYISLMIYGPLSPSELAKKSDIPRPRAYDVLRSLMEKGLLMEQSGKPSIYTAISPEQGLRNLFVTIEKETLTQLQEKRKTVEKLKQTLSQTYERSKKLKLEKSKVWFTHRDTAFIAIYSEAIRNSEKQFLVASTGTKPPEKEILEAVKYALKKGATVKVVRQINEQWTLQEIKEYEQVIKAGSQVRYLSINEIPLRFMTFDDKDVIIVFPSESERAKSQELEALWLRIPPLAKILRRQFEELWNKARPITPMIEELKAKKQAGKK
jgi:sugar-specific transcriptional regulator TrmB